MTDEKLEEMVRRAADGRLSADEVRKLADEIRRLRERLADAETALSVRDGLLQLWNSTRMQLDPASHERPPRTRRR